MRGVSVVRLSVHTDETTSPERQRQANQQAATALNIDLGDRFAVDLGVSASKTTPFERPELGAWLRRPQDFDALVCWRFDRLVRSMADIHAVSKWASEHRKMIVFAEGPTGRLVLDFRNPLDPMTQLLLTIFAFAAQMEAQAIRERVSGAQTAMRTMPLRWKGGCPPYGYMPAPMPGNAPGVTLVPDPEAVAVIERIIKLLRDDMPASAIAIALNAEGIPSPRDHRALRKGRKPGGKYRERFCWRGKIVASAVASESLLGWKCTANGPVRDRDGKPVRAAETSILTRAEHDAVVALLAARATRPTERSDTNALLLHTSQCATCGTQMYLDVSTTHGTYKCGKSALDQKCPAPTSIRADWAEAYAEREFLRLLGDLQVSKTRKIPGYDPAPEIAATLAEYEAHQAQQGRQRSQAARNAWQRRADALDTRLAELEARPAVPARVEVIHSDQTYADKWTAADTAGRRRMLRDAGAVLAVQRGTPGGWRHLDESRLEFDVTAPHFVDAASDAAAA